ncbi:glycoside hydrolase family 3 N-terminal domain-containing protein [Thermoleptolyngbya sp. C42_A2020_037]|uniref:glycoside hydrolase family 3 N-terminal domain-containing protein n=1 Tax=Thermoleptolyngbya sp. C42_A2020_037 TaxID=2747799 RepID=UPI0019ECFE50|nr:glycoside hydrolase family 3 N-terminal domain-containing protein [Thermoleptolyngbya sp. C42_A2020_037]MBF2086889.1 beta-glucosidase [Thermoleptolyngbya sp. C42_A2020_037]
MTTRAQLRPQWEDLSLPQQVAQMVVVRASGYWFDHQIQYPAWEPPLETLRYWVEDLGVGGVILLGGSAAEVAGRSHWLQSLAELPLLIAADVEEGVGQRFAGATWFPPPMALGELAQRDLPAALRDAEAMGAALAQEALAVGINWVLAPVVDVNNNPANPVINVRAFGDTPEIVSKLATAFIRGAQRFPVLTCAKHFPGHGDTATDSHLDLPLIPHGLARLEQIEFPPFQAAIAQGVDSVMSAHLLIPALDEQWPATLSRRILTGHLRDRLGFDGLVSTDALVMGAIAHHYGPNEAAVLAVEAGADILLMPADPEGTIRAVCDAVASGRIAPERIQDSLARIQQAKSKLRPKMPTGGTSHAWENLAPAGLEIEPLLAHLTQPQTQRLAADLLQASMRVHLPALSRLQDLTLAEPRRTLIVLDDVLEREFLNRTAPAIALPKQRGFRVEIIDEHTPSSLVVSEPSPIPTLLQLFVRGNPFRGSAGLSQLAAVWFRHLRDTEQLAGLVFYGSPYILEQFLPQLPAEVPYVFTYGQMAQAQAIALQTLLPAD